LQGLLTIFMEDGVTSERKDEKLREHWGVSLQLKWLN